MGHLPKSRLLALAIAGILTWLLAMGLGSYAPLIAGAAAGLFAPRRGAFLFAGLGAFLAWLIWFLLGSATGPLLPFSGILADIIGIPSLGGLLLPLLASLLGGTIAGSASQGVRLLTLPPREA